MRELDATIARRGSPATIVSDNGTELMSMTGIRWCQGTDIDWQNFAPGKLTQNTFVERFSGRLRNGLLNEPLFSMLTEARPAVVQRKEDFN